MSGLPVNERIEPPREISFVDYPVLFRIPAELVSVIVSELTHAQRLSGACERAKRARARHSE